MDIGRVGVWTRTDGLSTAEAVARTLFEGPLIARHIELVDARASLRDERVAREQARPLEIEFVNVNGTLDRRPGNDRATLSLAAQLDAGRAGSAAIEASGAQRWDGRLQLALATNDLPLHALRRYAELADPTSDLGGSLSGTLAFALCWVI